MELYDSIISALTEAIEDVRSDNNFLTRREYLIEETQSEPSVFSRERENVNA